jgi:hypothetical protein
MGSLIEELRRREAAARAEADRLRSRIEELAEDLAQAEEQASRLAIACEEVAWVPEDPASADPPSATETGPQRRSPPRPTLPACKQAGAPAAAFGHFRARITLVSPGQSQKTPSGDRARSSPRTSVANASTRSPNRWGADQEKEK